MATNKRKVYKVTHPDAGNLYCIFRNPQDVVECELDNGEPGDTISVEIIEMTDEQLENLPEFEGW